MRARVEIPDCAMPGQHGVYVAFDGSGEVLYIGRTHDLSTRLSGHRSQSPWYLRLRSVEFTPCAGPHEARVLEKSMIATFRPELNVNDGGPQQFSKRQALPDWTAAKLVGLHEACADRGRGPKSPENERLNNYIRALREGGWTLAAIGQALTMTREAVRLRHRRATKADGRLGVPPVPRKVKPKKRRPPQIPAVAVAEMRELQVPARQVKGTTPLDSPLRVATERYTELIAEWHLRGVSMYRISQQMGVTPLAIRARLARHGYMEEVKGLPGNVKYGTPFVRRKRTCHLGHPLSGDNLRLINGDPARRACRACARRRSNEYHARQKAGAA